MKARVAPTISAQGAPAAATVDRAETASGGSMPGESSIQFSALQTRIDQSPRMLAQRRAMQAVLGTAFQDGTDKTRDPPPNLPHPLVVQRVVGAEPESSFRSNLAWAQWFAAMTPTELDEQLDRHGMNRDSPGVAGMNQVLIRNHLPPLTDALPVPSEGGGLVIGVEEKVETADPGEKASAAVTGKKDDSPEDKYEKRISVVNLTIKAGSKSRQLTLELKNEYGETVASATENEGSTRTITKKLLGQGVITKGNHAVQKGNFHSVFKSTYDAFVIQAKADAHLESLKLRGDLDTSLPKQADFFGHLSSAMSRATGKGHATVKMAKIRLVKEVEYAAYGKRHAVSHLYIQTGNETEMRCYLGTDEGPFQRIHTSLTVKPGETPTAHTMVQISSKLGIPPFEGKGERVGFDSRETEARMGFEKRELTGRSKTQCTVDGYIDGKTLSEIGEVGAAEAKAMANSFNRTLDIVSKDICNGELENRVVTWLSEFKPIDER